MSSIPTIPQPEIEPDEEELRIERREERAARRRQHRTARTMLYGTIGSTALLLGLMGFIFLEIQNLVNINTLYPPINSVPCESGMSIKFHIHVHVSIYINGKSVTIPQGIGIGAGNICFYYMHTHTSDGIVHIEAPAPASNLALDDFLTIWHTGFSKLNFPQQLTLQTGWSIYVNGKPFTGVAITSPLNTEVPLVSHDAVTLDYGSHNPPPDKTYAFPAGLPT
ncbi:MAG TPA: hypothetical protein VNE61_07875 [Ktedonobacteraceae bacterium]|nr:hypothetical protein [Ktedonobacteraceae bacterium]